MATQLRTRPTGSADPMSVRLLTAATELAAGPRPVTIPSLRAVARAVGVSATAVYRHFPSQAALTRALLESEHERFQREVLAHDDQQAPAGDRLARLALAYVEWGRRNPGPYQLLFESADQLDEGCAYHHAHTELYDEVTVLLRALEQPSGGHPDQVQRWSERLLAGLHGIVSLTIHKPTLTWATPISDLVEDCLPPRA
jgi:AcrR family transcriptional regulator